MPFIDVTSVKVNFPFEPYACQVDYMHKLITCLREGYNGILESPTGTGKTLCLLCGSLAWLEDKKAQIASQRWKLAQSEPDTGALEQYKTDLAQQLDQAAGAWSGELAAPKIIYASRTHSQLAQAIQELKRTAYGHFKVCILGSREQLCIHPQVMKEENNTSKVHLCRSKVTTRTCHFYNSIENAKPHFQNQVMDIEDLVTLGKKHNCCPYYMARELKSDADIIFMPYNYLLDPKSRKAHGVELQGNIVIFDEAHNLERMCEESASFDLTSTDLASAIREINDLSQKLQDMHSTEEVGFDMSSGGQVQGQEFTLEEVLQIKAQILHLEEEIDKMPLPRPEEGVTKNGSFIFEILGTVNLSFGTKGHTLDVIDKVVSYLAGETGSSLFNSKGAGLSKFADVIKIVFSREPDERTNLDSHKKVISEHYKVHIQEVAKRPFNKKKADGWGAPSNAGSQKPSRTLSYWCFNPGHAMQDLKAHGVKSIILTSGTMSPLSSFVAEMGIPFPIQLENPHVIEQHQVWIGVVGQGPDGVKLSSAYSNRFKEEYLSSLGNAVVNFVRVVPHGVLLFFPSYPVMDKCMGAWQNAGIWNRVEQYKPIFVEPRNKAEFHTSMINYYDQINSMSNGAVFAAVCRGKVSEGLDFADNNGRAVVITGLPFPPRMDPRVMLKMQYLDDARKLGGKGLTGQQWYAQQASRAVNQAIGRVIRHKEDYGAIILCDERFSQSNSRAQLPIWIRSQVKTYANFGLALRDMMIFFKTAEQKMPQPGKKVKKAAKAGCEGAYFMPTLAKDVPSKVGALEKSGRVNTHVPSLRAESETTLGKLKIQYENATPKESAIGPKGLLDALRTDKGKSQDHHEVSRPLPSFQPIASSTQDKSKLKKKIVIKKSDSKACVEKDTLQSAEQYVHEVRTTLSAESYKFFSTNLAAYKKTGDYTLMVTSLADVFTDNPQKYHLFRRFYRFVRPQHKQQFDQTCKELIGQGCGFKPQDAVVKKRRASGLTEASHDKKQKVDQHFTKATEKCSSSEPAVTSSVHMDSSKHLSQRTISQSFQLSKDESCKSRKETKMVKTSKSSSVNDDFGRTACSIPIDSKPSCSTVHSDIGKNIRDISSANSREPRHLENSAHSSGPSTSGKCVQSTIRSDTQVFSGLECSQNPDKGCQNPDKGRHQAKDRASSAATNPPSTSATTKADGACATNKENVGKHTVLPLAVKEKNHSSCTSNNNVYACCHCAKDAVTPLKALCNHVCCMECWKYCIRETKSCPKCGDKVRRKNLSRASFLPNAQPSSLTRPV